MHQSFVLSLLFTLLVLVFSPVALAQDESDSDDIGDLTACTGLPAESVCGCIVNTSNSTSQTVFLATVALQCLTSVPFNPAVAKSLLNYVNDTLQFQSTLGYLKSPPPTYQQPAVDLLAGLGQIQDNVDASAYNNQYAFESALQVLLNSAHDSHLYMTFGISGIFTFAVLDGIVSLSSDGKQLPKLYLEDDLLEYTQGAGPQPSALSQINGQDAVEFMSNFANAYALGAVDAHSAYNQALGSAALDVLGIPSLIEGATTLFPGDQIVLTFENGTVSEPYPWIAYYGSPGDTGPLSTPGDFFNFFVTGFYPASYTGPGAADSDPNSKRDMATNLRSPAGEHIEKRQDRSSGWDNEAYPIPNVAQPDLSVSGNGFLSGYYYYDSGIAVLSIPSFDASDNAIDTFTTTVSQFIAESKAGGLTKLVIDLQQNSGGQTFLAIDTFKQFFPDTQPYLGSRSRTSDYLNLTGEAVTDFWESLATNDPDYYDLSTDEFVVTDRINALTGQNFTSWAEAYGPRPERIDSFTTPQQYNLSSFIFDVTAQGGFVQTAVFGYANNPANYSDPPFAPENIVLLTDGQCASACAVFVEMMTQDADVQTVVAGGLPVTGPMQAVGLSRGATLESLEQLDGNILFAQELYDDAGDPSAALLPNRTNEDVWIQDGGVNFRDMVRPNDTEPTQFKYLAADCRIFYTADTFYNYTNLWHYAANAIWTDTSLCVEGSTGFAGTAQVPPPIPPNLLSTGQSPVAALAGTQFIPLDINSQSQGTLHDAGGSGSARGAAQSGGKPCDSSKPNPCPGGAPCPRQRQIDPKKGIWSGTCPASGGSGSSRGRCSSCAKKR